METSVSINIVKAVETSPRIQVKVLEVCVKVLEAIGYGSVILPSTKRLEMVKLVQLVKTSIDDDDDVHNELWQSLVSMILNLPSWSKHKF